MGWHNVYKGGIMKKVFGIILLFIDLILLIGGLTCLIIGSILYRIVPAYHTPIVNLLFALGFVGVGSFSATLLVVLGSILTLSD